MKRRKRQPTRKQAALRWIAVLVILVAVSQVLQLCCLTPKQALRRYEQEYLLPEGEILAELENEKHTYLTIHGDTLSIGRSRFYWEKTHKGWYYQPYAFTAGGEDAAVWGQDWLNGTLNGTDGYKEPVFFGLVNDPDIVEVEIQLIETEDGTVRTACVPQEEFLLSESGTSVFLTSLEKEIIRGWRVLVTGIYADGRRTEPMNTLWNQGLF